LRWHYHVDLLAEVGSFQLDAEWISERKVCVALLPATFLLQFCAD